VVLQGKSVYLGKWDSPESRAEQERVISEWLAQGRQLPPQDVQPAAAGSPAAGDLTVAEMILAFWRHAEKHYRHPDGPPTREQNNLRDALRPLRRLFGRRRRGSLADLAEIIYELIRSGEDPSRT
jgi:hypothetical protein